MRFFLYIFILISLISCGSRKDSIENQSNQQKDSTTNQLVLDTLTHPEISIDKELANKIRPFIYKWLKYYDLDILDFRFQNNVPLHIEEMKNDPTCPYYRTVDKTDDVYIPILHDYSPDKSKYVDLLAATCVGLEDDGKYHFGGSDDCQHLSLFNRKDKSVVMFSIRGLHEFGDAVFWIDNNTFVIVSSDLNEKDGIYMLEIYNLKKDICDKYMLEGKCDKQELYYMFDMKARGIIID